MSSLQTQCIHLSDRDESLPILLSRSHILGILIAILTCVVAAAIVFTCIKNYTKRTTIKGETTITNGLIKISANQPGIIAKIYKKEGDFVQLGEPLFEVSNLASINDKLHNGRISEIVLHSLDEQINKNKENLTELINSQKNLTEKILNKRKNIDEQIEKIAVELQLQESSVHRAEENLSRNRALVSTSFLSPMALKAFEDELATQRIRKISLDRQKNELQNQANLATIEISELETRVTAQRLHYSQELIKLQAESAETKLKYASTIVAPASGLLRTITANKGDSVGSTTLGVIIPSGSEVNAQLLVPSRSIGFIEEGQKVRLRYHAFSYQKYGMFEGRISDVSLTPISDVDSPNSIASAETFFRVKIAIPDQVIHIENRAIPLTAGMTFDADIELGTRKIIEWIIEPLLILKKIF